jgi:hypothetical protein
MKEEFIINLSAQKKLKLLAHFNRLYTKPLTQLGKDEWNIIYLAWLWKSELVTRGKNGHHEFDEEKAGVSLSDYEKIRFGEEIYMPGSYNLESIHMQYEFDNMMKIL